MITIYLARHGQTEENISRIFQGHLPGHLTEEGKQQAVELGKRLRDIPLDAILSSDLQRVIDTVRLAVGDRNLPWQTTPLLREIDWGSWTGLPLDSVDRTHLPADAETREMLYERAGMSGIYPAALRREMHIGSGSRLDKPFVAGLSGRHTCRSADHCTTHG